jgi:hypothetical protein
MIRRSTFLVLLTIAVLGLATPAGADEAVGCRIVEVDHGAYGEATYEKECWLVGVDGTYTVTETEPPVLYPQLGSNLDGSECWSWTTTVTQWVIISRDGSLATIGRDVGVGIVLDATMDACEGIPGDDLRTVAWDFLERWLLAEPEIELSPLSSGVTGLETYVWAPIPDQIDGTLTSPAGTTLQARAWVDQVVVDWGDVTTSPLVLDELQLGRFAAYPDGSAYHVYGTKTCNEEGQTGCYPEVDGYPLTVSFRWQAAYRVGANPWIDIGPVTPLATVDYPVDEIITRIETTG